MQQQVIDLVNAGINVVSPFVQAVLGAITNQKNDNGTAAKQAVEKAVIVRHCPADIMFNRNLVRVAGVSGALAVALGAYGSHVIEMNHKIDEERKRSFRSANLYHFIGTFGLIASALARRPVVSGSLMAAGTFVFCGSCYAYAMTGHDMYKKYAPLGGTTLIVAWLSLVM